MILFVTIIWIQYNYANVVTAYNVTYYRWIDVIGGHERGVLQQAAWDRDSWKRRAVKRLA